MGTIGKDPQPNNKCRLQSPAGDEPSAHQTAEARAAAQAFSGGENTEGADMHIDALNEVSVGPNPVPIGS